MDNSEKRAFHFPFFFNKFVMKYEGLSKRFVKRCERVGTPSDSLLFCSAKA